MKQRCNTSDLAKGAAWRLALLGIAACNLPPGFEKPDNSTEMTPGFFVLNADNPTLGGLVSLQHMVDDPACGGGACETFLTTQYLMPLDVNNVATTEASYGGNFDFHVQADRPVFQLGIKKLGQSPFATTFNTETWAQDVDDRIRPWIWFPNYSQCTSLADPACAKDQGKTFTFFADNVLLPRGLDVTFSLQLRRGGPFVPVGVGGARTTVTETLATIEYMASAELRIVPVHVHVFADSQGRNDFKTFPLDGTDAQAAVTAQRAQQIFDLGRIRDEGGAIVSNGSTTSNSAPVPNSWGISHTSALAQSMMFFRQGLVERAFARCANLRFRLATFNIIRQSEGVEQQIPELGHAGIDCTSLSGGHFTRDAQGNILNPAMAFADEILRSAATPKDPAVCAASPELCPPVGVHVFITGFFADATTGASSGTLGVGCPGSLTDPAYAVFTDSQSAVGGSADSLMVHELGHVLGLGEAAATRLENTFFAIPEEPYPVDAADEAACTAMRMKAETQYVQDFSIYPSQPLP